MAALVKQLLEPSSRATALLKLSKKRESIPYLAPLLWHSFGSVAVLLQEVVAIYPALQPPTLTRVASNRVCNALALLQSVASHQETRQKFLAGGLVHAETPAQRCGPRPPAFPTAHIPLYLYPFLNTLNQEKPFEYLRLTSLGVIGALVKVGLCVLQLAWPCCTPDSRPPHAARRQRCRQLLVTNRDHPAVPAHHGVWLGPVQDSASEHSSVLHFNGSRPPAPCAPGGHVHRAENPPGRCGAQVHLRHRRAVLRRCVGLPPRMDPALAQLARSPQAQ